MGVIVICMRTPRSARENFGCTWEHLGVPMTSLGVLTTCLEAPQITIEQSGKNDIFGNVAGGPGNHSYYLSFNDS